MRMDSRCAGQIVLTGCLLMLLSQSGLAQLSARQDSMQPSPLSQFGGASEFFNRPAGTGNGQSLLGPSHHVGDELITREVDLRDTLKKYAAFKQCSMNEAFSETVAFLKMVPARDNAATEMLGARALYSVVKQDVYRITGSKNFFETLPTSLMCIANGKRNLSLEIHFVSVPASKPTVFNDVMIPGSFVSFNNKIPQATPYATSASYRDEADNHQANSTSAGTFVSASETRTKVYPTFMGRLNDEGVAKLMEMVKSNPASSITMAPTITIMPGQPASVSDASSRPFVVGVNRIEGEFTSGHQPVIQPIEEGTMLKVRATGEHGKIRLDADLALSLIESVGTFEYTDSKRTGNGANHEVPAQINLQVPEQRLKQVHFSTLVEEGQTVFVDPVFERVVKTKNEKRKKQTTVVQDEVVAKSRILLMIKPRWVEAN